MIEKSFVKQDPSDTRVRSDIWKTSPSKNFHHATSTPTGTHQTSHREHVNKKILWPAQLLNEENTHLPSVDSQVVEENSLEEARPLLLLFQLFVLLHFLTSLTLCLPDSFNDCINGVNLEPRLDSIPAQTCSYHSEIIEGRDAEADLEKNKKILEKENKKIKAEE